MSLELNHKLDIIQTFVLRLKKKISIEIKFISYAAAIQKTIRFLFEIRNEAVESFKISNIKIITQSHLNYRNIIIFIINENEKKKLKKMSNENLLKIMQKIVKKIRNVIRLRSKNIRIQTKLVATKTIFQINHD
jgi:hypothetical protein